MRGMGLVEEKRADKQEQYDANNWIDHCGLAQTPVVRLHQSKHPQQSNEEPSGLAGEKYIGMAVLLFRRDCRGAEDHHGAKQA